MSTITAEMLGLDTLTPAEIRRLKGIDTFKSVILDWERASASADIDYSNQSTFTVGGAEMSLAMVVLVAKSALTISAEYEDKDKSKAYIGDNVKLGSLVAEAWSVLRRVQAGKRAQEQEFSLQRDALAAFVESAI